MSEMDKVVDSIKEQFAKTNAKIDNIQSKLDEQIGGIRDDVIKQSDRIALLERYAASDGHRFDSISYQIEVLKQDRLRNNIRFTGLPTSAYNNIIDTVIKIIKALNLNLLPSDFVAYADRRQSAIIVAFEKLANKRLIIDTLRLRKGILIEEIFGGQSDAKLICNDQLTPFFARLFHEAWQAKRDGLLYAASSLGGRIRVRKTESSNFTLVQSETHLNDIIANGEGSASTEISPINNNGSLSSPVNNQLSINNNIERGDTSETQKRPLERESPSHKQQPTKQLTNREANFYHRNNQRYQNRNQNNNGRRPTSQRRQNQQDESRHFNQSSNQQPFKKASYSKPDWNNNRNSNYSSRSS